MLNKVIETDYWNVVPFTQGNYWLSKDGQLQTSERVDCELTDLNTYLGTNVKDIAVLLVITFHPWNIAPYYWDYVEVLPTIDGVDRPETLIPKFRKEWMESIEIPNHYLIPKFSDYLITKEGKLLKRSNGRYIKASKGSGDYFTFRMTSDTGNTSNQYRHRIMLYAESNYDSRVSDLDTNHKNGIRGDDRIENLEWTTRQENCLHASHTDLLPDSVAVEVRNVCTNECMIFPSYSTAGRHFNVTETTISSRCKSSGKINYSGYQFRVFSSRNTDWPRPVNHSQKTWRLAGEGIDIETNSVEAANYLGLTRTSFLRAVRGLSVFERNNIRAIRISPLGK